MTCHVHRVKRVKSGDAVWPSKKPRAHQVGLMELSDLLWIERGIGFLDPISFGALLLCFAVAAKDPGDRGQRGRMTRMPLLEFPMDDLRSDSRECRTFCAVRFQLFSEGQDGLNRGFRSSSPNPFRGSTPILETLKAMLLVTAEPFGEPKSPSLNKDKNSLKGNPSFVELYCLTAFVILSMLIHRSQPLPNQFWGEA
jgi:hypothetical protein